MIVAVTGTKGKTTVVSMVNYCLSKLGMTTSSVCTLGLYRGLDRRTKKSPIPVYDRFFEREMDSDFQCIEITSRLLRDDMIPNNIADVVVLTGIERGEHEEIHSLFRDYVEIKRKIYDIRKPKMNALVCSDGLNFSDITQGIENVVTYGFAEGSDLKIEVKEQTDQYAVLQFLKDGECFELVSRVLGKHNYRNLAACYLALTELGIESRLALKKMSKYTGSPGRFERYLASEHGFGKEKTVIIDYAHTPKSLRETLTLLREIYPDEKVCTVFGCGGNKSVTKRPLMGREATSLSDVVIVANDNPRYESAEKIVDDILAGALIPCIVEMDRERAISLSLESDCGIILLAGKGAEEEYKISDKVYINRSDKTLLERVCREKKYELFPYPKHI